MSEPFISEIRMMSFNFAPKYWALCNGQTMAINQNQALFSLLGTTFGGNGQTTFALPDLRGRSPIHMDSVSRLGESAGEEYHALTASELPTHSHAIQATNRPAAMAGPAGNFLAAQHGAYAAGAGTTMTDMNIVATGGGQAHENRQPFTVLVFCIALVGIYPSAN